MAKKVEDDEISPDNKRTRGEMTKARCDMEDLFYPPKVDSWDSPCEGCGEKLVHKSDCRNRRNSIDDFRGWASYVKKTKVPQGKCDSHGCKRKAVMRIRLNVWGTIGEFDVCEKDGMNNGKSRDGHLCDCV